MHAYGSVRGNGVILVLGDSSEIDYLAYILNDALSNEEESRRIVFG